MTATAPHVTCTEFCGKPIYDDADHDASCGAPPDERARIARELSALKIQAAAGDNETEYSWRCGVCSHDLDSEDDMLAHITEDHAGTAIYWKVNPDDGSETAIEVDGKDARRRRGPAREQVDDLPEWRDPPVPGEWVLIAQKEIDDGKIVLGGLTAGKACAGKEVIDGHELDCIHLTVMRSVKKNECDLGHKHSETIAQLCLIHWIRLLAADIAPAGTGPLFAND